jgi:hypothetical protein
MSIKVASPVASSDAGMDHIRTLIDEKQLMKQLDQDRRQNQPESPDLWNWIQLWSDQRLSSDGRTCLLRFRLLENLLSQPIS